jgi:hypothetical protein
LCVSAVVRVCVGWLSFMLRGVCVWCVCCVSQSVPAPHTAVQSAHATGALHTTHTHKHSHHMHTCLCVCMLACVYERWAP